MAMCEIMINLKLTNPSGEVENHPVKVDVELPEFGPMLIDNVEKAILEANKDAIRRAVSTYLEELSKKNGIEGRDQRDVVKTNSTYYRVDSEIGRFEFPTHAVYRDGVCIFNTSTDLFQSLDSREHYLTAGFKELALELATDKSYRKSASFLNRLRWQTENGTPMRTLANIVENEGQKAQEVLNNLAEQVLTEHNFNQEGAPQNEDQIHGLSLEQVSLPSEAIAKAIEDYNRDKTEEYQIDSVAANQLYENPSSTVNTAIDDVGVKKQKETGRSAAKTQKEHREYVHNTIAHVEKENDQYILNGASTTRVLRLLIAFLLFNGFLQGNYLVFFVDGARSLHADILRMFKWLPNFRIILDWYHLKEKNAQELSMALKGSKIRNEILDYLLPLLWLGKIDAAIEYLRSIKPEYIKSSDHIERLIGYFERNRSYIPCYALRKQLGLRNSSNRGEKANDLCVADRQKHQGMSWSKSGSVALATIITMHINNEQLHWYTQGKRQFRLAA